jgi:hypothetical protein
MRNDRSVRRAQAVNPYGPGAILDLGQETFIVLDTTGRDWLRAPKISLERLEKHLHMRDGFRQPPVEESGLRLDLQRFPSWLFCPSCRRMWRWGRNEEVEAAGDLPKCKARSCNGSILVPMRYLAVCANGHTCDVDWWKWAHSDSGTRSEGQCSPRQPRLKFTTNPD